jgi:hypothetical protein
MRIFEILGLKKPTVPKTPKKVKYKRPPKVTVHLKNGDRVVHYAGCRVIHADGGLTLYSKWDKEKKTYVQEDLVADYSPGTWSSITTGTRKVVKCIP